MRRFVLAVLTAASAVACGGGATAPSPPVPGDPHFPAGTALTFVSGETLAPVAGATVTIGGTSTNGEFQQSYLSDAAGRITLDRPVLHTPAASVDVSADGFLLRETFIRSATETTFTLWPATNAAGLSETFTSSIVYSGSACPPQSGPGGQLIRHTVGSTATIVLDASIQTALHMARHEEAARLMTGRSCMSSAIP